VLMCCCFILYLHNQAAAKTDILRISLVVSTSSRRSLHQSAACGGHPRLLFLLLASQCVRLKTFGHVIKL
jgi:hypothetical protein